ncbi:Ger(x)C family spore germination protein [Paenibacillus harenae]|uniref:Spore germination protein n=1 Tax=Paenibacillus harenae TaxID=306543 RepID=A0ABT9U8L9_PAEHA|nr:Ger(x)C family spore germination protein [Paenibacillus harenae]MDQ0115346.1 spore germination protein [Paenibacillus harenae]
MIPLRKKALLLQLFAVLLVLTGCGDEKILERLGFIHTAGYELVPAENSDEPDRLRVTIAVPKADPEGKIKRETMTAVVATSKEAKIEFSRQTELSLVSGQLRNTLFGAALARKGIGEHIDTFVRDPAISQRMKITVVNGNVQHLLTRRYAEHPRPGQYVDRMLDKEAEAMMIPNVTLYDFTRDYYDDGIDAVAPIIREKGKDITIDGIALFQGDRYVARIDPDDSLIFAILRRNFKRGEMSINLNSLGYGKEKLLFSSMVSSRKIKVNRGENGGLSVQIRMLVKGSVLEYVGDLKIGEEEDRHKLEKRIAEYLTSNAQKMIDAMQRHKADSIGIGKHVRNSMSYAEWKSTNWDELYPNIEVKCSTEVVIKHFGKFM